MKTEFYNRAIAAFEIAHREDPHSDFSDGEAIPAEWLYTQRLVNRIKALRPDASEELLLAGYCQHLYRWEIARSDYPDGRNGYLEWRTFLAKYQSQKAAEILANAGFSEQTISRIRSITLKDNLHNDEEAQTLEDAVCLIFMEYYLEDFAAKNQHLEFKRILFKTMDKMSKGGIAEALKISFPEQINEILKVIIR
jgi:predicted PolB exonuclease-like 3'-5' exonuclease